MPTITMTGPDTFRYLSDDPPNRTLIVPNDERVGGPYANESKPLDFSPEARAKSQADYQAKQGGKSTPKNSPTTSGGARPVPRGPEPTAEMFNGGLPYVNEGATWPNYSVAPQPGGGGGVPQAASNPWAPSPLFTGGPVGEFSQMPANASYPMSSLPQSAGGPVGEPAIGGGQSSLPVAQVIPMAQTIPTQVPAFNAAGGGNVGTTLTLDEYRGLTGQNPVLGGGGGSGEFMPQTQLMGPATPAPNPLAYMTPEQIRQIMNSPYAFQLLQAQGMR